MVIMSYSHYYYQQPTSSPTPTPDSDAYGGSGSGGGGREYYGDVPVHVSEGEEDFPISHWSTSHPISYYNLLYSINYPSPTSHLPIFMFSVRIRRETLEVLLEVILFSRFDFRLATLVCSLTQLNRKWLMTGEGFLIASSPVGPVCSLSCLLSFMVQRNLNCGGLLGALEGSHHLWKGLGS